MRLVSASTEVNTGIEKSVSHGEVLQTDISVFFPDNEPPGSYNHTNHNFRIAIWELAR
jgi:hypothetical protein